MSLVHNSPLVPEENPSSLSISAAVLAGDKIYLPIPEALLDFPSSCLRWEVDSGNVEADSTGALFTALSEEGLERIRIIAETKDYYAEKEEIRVNVYRQIVILKADDLI